METPLFFVLPAEFDLLAKGLFLLQKSLMPAT